MLPTAKQFNKKYLEALKNIRLQLVQTSFLPNFLSNQVKSIHPLSFEGKFPPCNHAPLAYKRVHSLAAEFKNIRTNPTQLSVLFIVKLVRKVNSMETGVNLIIDIYIYIIDIYIYIYIYYLSQQLLLHSFSNALRCSQKVDHQGLEH
jgi:hypothetical protein